MEAYEKFEDAVESIYALLGKSDINFWPLAEYGNKKYNEITGLNLNFMLTKQKKEKEAQFLLSKCYLIFLNAIAILMGLL